MTKPLLLTLGLVWSISSFGTTVHPKETWLSPIELAELGINVEFLFGLACGNATEVTVSIPKEHRGASFSGATLELKEEGQLLFYANVRHAKPEELVENSEGSSELFVCLHSSFYELAVLRLHYAKGQHISHIISFRIDSAESQ